MQPMTDFDSEFIPFEDLPSDQRFEAINGMHPLQCFDDVCRKERYMQYFLKYGAYELLALLDALQTYFREIEDYLKCAKVRTVKFGLLKGTYDYEFSQFEITGGDIESIPNQTIVVYEEE